MGVVGVVLRGSWGGLGAVLCRGRRGGGVPGVVGLEGFMGVLEGIWGVPVLGRNGNCGPMVIGGGVTAGMGQYLAGAVGMGDPKGSSGSREGSCGGPRLRWGGGPQTWGSTQGDRGGGIWGPYLG